MHRLAERHAVQRVGTRPGRQHPHHAVGQLADHRVEHVGLLDPLGQHGRRRIHPGLRFLAARRAVARDCRTLTAYPPAPASYLPGPW